MSWIEKLSRTYDNNITAMEICGEGVPLLPACHTTQNAQIEVTINEKGKCLRATVIPKDEAITLMPCTEKSASRSGSKPEHHPLADKLQYLAPNFVEFGGEVTSGFAKNPKYPHLSFMADLQAWCTSDNSHWKVEAIWDYLKRGTLLEDLVQHRILHLASDGERAGKLLYEWSGDSEMPEIFGRLPGKLDNKGKRGPWQADALVRWRVERPGELDSSTQTDTELQQAWIAYYCSMKETTSLCIVSGQQVATADSHPAKIRNGGDKGKLISSNDTSGFTYRGRFTEARQVCSVGFKVSQKAYNALRWLIARQGWRSGSQAIVSWAVSGAEIPNALDDTSGLFGGVGDEQVPPIDTAQEFGRKLSARIAGYSANLGATDEIVVMGLDSATPGRMAITFYRELTGSQFLSRIDRWHRSCCWFQNLGKDRKFIGAPAPNDIAKAAYGKAVDEKLKRSTVARLLPCIIDGMALPPDLVEACVRNAGRRYAYENWEWEKILGIACALYRCYCKNKEDYEMALDPNRKTRDYLYGRLLAVGDCIEKWALQEAGEKRPTNAARLMQRFADHPCSTWRTIDVGLAPYRARLGGRIKRHEQAMHEIMNAFDADEFADDKTPLSGEFLLGFYCQRASLYENEEKETTEGVGK